MVQAERAMAELMGYGAQVNIELLVVFKDIAKLLVKGHEAIDGGIGAFVEKEKIIVVLVIPGSCLKGFVHHLHVV
jgi:hypothetical protein